MDTKQAETRVYYRRRAFYKLVREQKAMTDHWLPILEVAFPDRKFTPEAQVTVRVSERRLVHDGDTWLCWFPLDFLPEYGVYGISKRFDGHFEKLLVCPECGAVHEDTATTSCCFSNLIPAEQWKPADKYDRKMAKKIAFQRATGMAGTLRKLYKAGKVGPQLHEQYGHYLGPLQKAGMFELANKDELIAHFNNNNIERGWAKS